MKEKYIIIILFVVIIAACSIYGSISHYNKKIDNLNMVIHDQNVLINYQDSIIIRFSYCED